MKAITVKNGFFFITLFMATITISAQTAEEILKMTDEVTYAPDDQVSSTIITLIDKNGSESVRKAEMKQKGRSMRLTRFTAPASQAGIAFLSLPGDVMYIYLPAFGRERRIASHVKNQSFAGTDFTYEDMEAVPFSEKFTPHLLETTGEHFILELTPREGIRSDYSKLVIYVNKEHYYSTRTEFYDRGGRKAKELTITSGKVQGFWAQKEMTMQDLVKNHTTRIAVENISFNNDLDDSEFTVRKLVQQ